LLLMPMPAWSPLLAALFTAAFFMLLTVKWVVLACAFGVLAIAMLMRWLWETDPGPAYPPAYIGGGIKVPVYVTGPSSHSWWAMVILIFVSASMYLCLIFSYLFMWTVKPAVWHAPATLPSIGFPLLVAALLIASSAAIHYASHALQKDRCSRVVVALIIASLILIAALVLEITGQERSGLMPTQSSYSALVYTFASIQGFFIVVVVMMAFYTCARATAGLLNHERRVTFDNTMLFWHYTVVQGLAGIAVVHGFPRIVGG
jgi:cytochrome c oxidase subunit I+III